MKFALAIVGCFACTTAAAAAPSIEEVTRQVAEVAERHVNTIACPGVRITPADVTVLVPEQVGETVAKFAVLWNGDLGCNRGSGTERTNLTIVTVDTGRALVQPQLSSPAVAFDSPVRFVRRVVGSGPDSLVLEGKEYGPGDPNSNPTVPVRFTLRADAKGNWALVNKSR